MARELTIKVHSDDEIQQKLEEQRSKIETDVDKTIEVFLKTVNKTAGRSLLRSIYSFPTPQEGFGVWKGHFENPDDHALQDKFREKKISKTRLLSELWMHKANEQRINGKNVNGILPTFSRVTGGFTSLAITSLIGEIKGGLNAGQSMIMGGMSTLQSYTDGPLYSGDPLHSTLMPHMHAAIAKKYASTLEELQASVKAKEPLLDESLVRSLRDEILAKSIDKFERMAAQSYGDQNDYKRETPHLSAALIPDDATFGIELEGFMASPDSYGVNMINIQAAFRAFGLEAKRLGLMPKKNNEKYDKWNVVFDPSVQNPLYFTDQQGIQNKQQSMGMEVVSPILHGKKGAQDLGTALHILKFAKFRTNETCGMHIHVDLNDTTLEQRKNLAKALKRNEEKIDRFVGEGRRGHGSVYAKSFESISEDAIDAAENDEQFVSAVNPDNDRDFKFDFTGLVIPDAPRTIQLRGEGGAGYLPSVVSYTVLMVNFVKEALDNPDIDLDETLENLVSQTAVQLLKETNNESAQEPANDVEPEIDSTPQFG